MKKILFLIIILAAILRLNNLAAYPALNADEASLGYNAYSLLQTGRDEHGNPWPIHFQSFNDYKPGFYVYLLLPFVSILGMTEWAVRLPGALLGVGSVISLYFLVKLLFARYKFLPELSALFLALSPWHIHFSRGAWEVNVATFFIISGVLAFFIALKRKQSILFVISALLLVASLYTYHAARLVVPLLLFVILLIYWKEIVGNFRKFIPAILLGLLFVIPLAIDLARPTGVSRAAGVGLFADTGPYWRINQQRGEHEDLESPFIKLLHNKPVNYSLKFLENYSEHYWGEFLFISGDQIQRNKVPEMGQLYLIELLFLIVGLISIARNFSRAWAIILCWLLIAPVASALTFQSPHALRSQNMVVPLEIISALGLLKLLEGLSIILRKRKVLLSAAYCVLLTIMIWDVTRYLHQYYVHMAKDYDYSSQYGAKELAQYIKENYDNYPKFVVTTAYDQPYILMLFYLKVPPKDFQNNHNLTARDQYGFSTVSEFDKFVFKPVNPLDQIKQEYPGALIAGTEGEVPIGANVIHEIYFPSGRQAFRLVKN